MVVQDGELEMAEVIGPGARVQHSPVVTATTWCTGGRFLPEKKKKTWSPLTSDCVEEVRVCSALV